MKYHILYNPISGSGRATEAIDRVKSLIDGECTVTSIIDVKDYAEYFSTIAPEDTLVICGGDGTLNRFVNDIRDNKIGWRVCYYACGTGNDFLHDIKGEVTPELIEINKYIENLPVADINGKSYRFINGIGYGIDGYCCEEGDRLRALSDKPVDYTAIAIKGLLLKYKPADATVTVDGVEYKYKKVWIAPTMNGRMYGGGMIPTPDQDRLSPDKKVSVMILYGKSRLGTLMMFPSIFKGEHVKYTDAVAVHTGKEITVKYGVPRPLQVDGETITDVCEYTVHCDALVAAKK